MWARLWAGLDLAHVLDGVQTLATRSTASRQVLGRRLPEQASASAPGWPAWARQRRALR